MLTLWDPFREMSSLHNRIFNGAWPDRRSSEFVPAVDIYEDEKAIYLKAELPGIEPENIKVNIEKNVLSLHGERKMEKEDEREGYHRIERSYGSFSRSFVLPNTVKHEEVDAAYKDGVLTLTMPKTPEAKAREIKINSN